MSTKRKLWSVGIILAVVGVILARLVARQIAVTELQFAIYVVGILMALGGLAVILYGLRSKN